jgi:23S rRNA (guanine745-N1)-methyltransferase
VITEESKREQFVAALRCPVCGNDMWLDGTRGAGCLCCRGERVHTFDLARSGYVHLAPRHSGGGDSKEAVRARTAFLSEGYYAAAAEALCELVAHHVPSGLVVDAGCGEGYYTNRVAAGGGEARALRI